MIQLTNNVVESVDELIKLISLKDIILIIVEVVFVLVIAFIFKIPRRISDYCYKKIRKRIRCKVGIGGQDYPFPNSYYITFYARDYHITREYLHTKIADCTRSKNIIVRDTPNRSSISAGEEQIFKDSISTTRREIDYNFKKEDLKDILKKFYLKGKTDFRLYDEIKKKLSKRRNIELILEYPDETYELFKVPFYELRSEDFECPAALIKITNQTG